MKPTATPAARFAVILASLLAAAPACRAAQELADLSLPMKVVRPAFNPAFELFTSSGQRWPDDRLLGAQWAYDLPDGARLDGLAVGQDKEVLVVETGADSFEHTLRRLDPSGQSASSAALTGFIRSIAAGELGGRPVIVGQDLYHAQVYDPAGRPLWPESRPMESAMLLDADGDGKSELVGSPAKHESVLSAVKLDGRTLWTAKVPADDVDGLTAASLPGGALVATFAARRGLATVFILDGKGKPVLDFDDETAPELGAFTLGQDKTPLLVHIGSKWRAGHDRLKVSRLRGGTRKTLFEADLGPTHALSMALADIDGDGGREIVLGTDNGWVLVYDGAARLLAERRFFGAVSFLASADLDGDGRDEVFAGIQGATSRVYGIGLGKPGPHCCDVPAPPPQQPGVAGPAWSAESSRALEAFLEDGPEGPVVFDADGTLWADDAGEAFLRWLVAERKLVGVDYGKDLYAEYEARVRKDKAEGYGWAAAVMAGIKEEDANLFADEFIAVHFADRYYAPVRELIGRLRDAGRQVWVVSASNRWVVEAGARYLEIDPGRVIAIDLEVDGGVLTGKLKRPLPYGAGKVAAIKRRIGRRPALAVGDSLGDEEMLRHSAGPAVLITHGGATSPDLVERAREKGWILQEFPLREAWRP